MIHSAGAVTDAAASRAHALGLLLAVLYGDIISEIENAIIGFFEGIWNGIQSFFGTIFGAIANTFAVIFSAPGNALNVAWVDMENSVAGFGIFAPIVTIAVVFLVLAIATVLIWLIIKISTSEAEQTGEEAEEGV